MLEFSQIAFEIITWIFLIYGTAVFLVYTWIGVYALGAVIQYKKENTFTDYNIIAANPNAPTFSLIAPAYNEGITIVENVRSLLSLYYHHLEIIIVNDGSKDNSMEMLIKAYELECISFFIQGKIETKNVRNVYKSKNPAFKKLIVVDKENGGKADALNVGVNISSGDYLVCIDVDCILEQDAILKLAKPFLEQTEKKVIACGGVIRLANNCKIENGKVTDVNIPKTLLGRTQALEYIRAFVLGRMAWSRASGLILISGAFGVFDREIVLACGGYDRNTVGEDMELVVRMRKYMEEKKEPYEVITIPDPLCWTEVPESKDILQKQRNRWMRGTMETLWKHRRLMFNPKYGKLGMISLPYWFFFEFLGPLIEFSGYIFFFLFLFLGIINWPFFLILFALVISTGFLFSIYAILVDLVSHQVYAKRKDFLTLIGTAILEPFYFHPLVVRAGISGFIDYFKKSHAWGEMTRQGFNQQNKNLPFTKRMEVVINHGLKKWGVFASLLFILFSLGTVVEWGWYKNSLPDLKGDQMFIKLMWNNVVFILKIISGFGIIYLIINFIKESWAKLLAIFTCTFLIINQFILFLYFSESHNLLGADIFFYSIEEMKQILQASGMISIANIFLILVLISSVALSFWFSSRTFFHSKYVGLFFILLGIPLFFIPSKDLAFENLKDNNEFTNTITQSKWNFFLNSNFDNYLSEHPEYTQFWEAENEMAVSSEMLDKQYPFWRKEITPDFLGSYLTKSAKAPNLVIILVEGMGHSYSSKDGYVGNFTPFINSLSNKSLYWENALSSSGRTFSAIPTITGSLPFGKNGFLEISKTPGHFNLYNILKHNGFQTGFFYGGNSSFDRIRKYLEYSGVDQIVDQFKYTAEDKKLPAKDGNSWGYEDQAVFKKVLQVQKVQNQPYFNTILTLSSHNPFLINNPEIFEKKYYKILNSTQLNATQEKWARENKKQLISILNADDAVREFITNYQKRPDFENTIFVITGDHAMPEIPLESKIDRYHVPFLIYSNLVKKPQVFRKIISHFDLTPSILAYYRTNYQLKTPTTVSWLGKGFSPTPMLDNVGIPIMKSKSQLSDYVYGNHYLEENQLYLLNNLNAGVVDQPAMLNKVSSHFKQFKNMNSSFYKSQKLFPDSVMTNYFKTKSP